MALRARILRYFREGHDLEDTMRMIAWRIQQTEAEIAKENIH